jgi:hypothetical protein
MDEMRLVVVPVLCCEPCVVMLTVLNHGTDSSLEAPDARIALRREANVPPETAHEVRPRHIESLAKACYAGTVLEGAERQDNHLISGERS